MDTNKRIIGIKPFFKEMNVCTDTRSGKQVIYVTVSFPNGWVVDDATQDKFDVTITGNEDGYAFVAYLEEGFDRLFDAIEYNIEKNRAAQERAALFQQKIAELQRVFEDEEIPIEKLREMKFSYEEKKQPSAKKKKEKQHPVSTTDSIGLENTHSEVKGNATMLTVSPSVPTTTVYDSGNSAYESTKF